MPQSHTWKKATHGAIEYVCKPAIIYNTLSNHVAKMVGRPTVSTRGGQKSPTRTTTTGHDLLFNTVNRERFAGLNFRGFQEYRKSFSVNISDSL